MSAKAPTKADIGRLSNPSFAFGLRIMEEVAPMFGKWGCFQNSTKYTPLQFAHTEARGALKSLLFALPPIESKNAFHP